MAVVVGRDPHERDLERGPKGDHGQDGKKGDTGERGPANRRALIGYLIFAAVVVIAFYGVFAILSRAEDATIINCREIETLKMAEREDAWDRFNNLSRNLRLLKIRKTPALVDIAKRDRDVIRNRFKEKPCPRPSLP